ncbi:hypothetical protein C8T65DRAFT_763417 [Cerioporus squamosus]|nr:hypothetical protein C8T65DRAFT_763417 [Cerioporus squamosus]
MSQREAAQSHPCTTAIRRGPTREEWESRPVLWIAHANRELLELRQEESGGVFLQCDQHVLDENTLPTERLRNLGNWLSQVDQSRSTGRPVAPRSLIAYESSEVDPKQSVRKFTLSSSFGSPAVEALMERRFSAGRRMGGRMLAISHKGPTMWRERRCDKVTIGVASLSYRVVSLSVKISRRDSSSSDEKNRRNSWRWPHFSALWRRHVQGDLSPSLADPRNADPGILVTVYFVSSSVPQRSKYQSDDLNRKDPSNIYTIETSHIKMNKRTWDTRDESDSDTAHKVSVAAAILKRL